jgi:hypothetical protein
MTSHAGNIPVAARSRRARWSAGRRFYVGFATALAAAVFFAGWFLLLVAQPLLVAAGRVDVHRRLGLLGGGLAVAMVILGTVGALKAAGRPTGFVDIPMPPLEFLVVPLADIALFGGFVALADDCTRSRCGAGRP